MVQIGSVTIKGPAVLAPMAGTADRAFREICASFGAAYVISEMVSAKALTYGDKKSRELMELSSQERPAVRRRPPDHGGGRRPCFGVPA